MAATSDPHTVARHDEHNLRQFLAARRAGDEAGARHWWDELVTANFDRVRGMLFLQKAVPRFERVPCAWPTRSWRHPA